MIRGVKETRIFDVADQWLPWSKTTIYDPNKSWRAWAVDYGDVVHNFDMDVTGDGLRDFFEMTHDWHRFSVYASEAPSSFQIEHLKQWCHETLTGQWMQHYYYMLIGIKNDADAVHFKLRWVG